MAPDRREHARADADPPRTGRQGIRAGLSAYLTAQDQARSRAVDRVLGALEPRERALVREAAVMGFVQGSRSAPRAPIPPDSVVTWIVVDACVAFSELYPTVASLSGPVRPSGPWEEIAAAMLALHRPVCPVCNAPHGGCTHSAGPVCATCSTPAVDVRTPARWPCPSVRVFGRVAVCGNLVERDDLTADRCPGFLLFRAQDAQARCLECGAWCGAQVATYVEVT